MANNYDELVKSLRRCGSMENADDNCIAFHDGCCEEEPLCMYELMRQAADAIEELQAVCKKQEIDLIEMTGELASKPKWIPVTERLPEEDESVFVVRKFLGIKGQIPPSTYTEIAYRIRDSWVADSDEYKIARHRHTDPLFWMPLPDPPKEET